MIRQPATKQHIHRWVALLFSFVMAQSALGAGGTKERSNDCEGPSELVEVTAETGELGYFFYDVHNRHGRAVHSFLLGRGERAEMINIPENVPRRLQSPTGWEGQVILLPGGEALHILWSVSAKEHWIPPNGSLKDFGAQMPERSLEMQESRAISDRRAVPLDMKKAAFQVRFDDGKCVWGRVKERPPRPNDCEGPSALVEVTVEAAPLDIFYYTVHNRHDRAVHTFLLGRGEQREMLIAPENIPAKVQAPTDWEGRDVFLHESKYMQIIWHAREPEHEIPAGESLSGFDVQMPERTIERKESSSSSDPRDETLDMKSAPFLVVFSGGGCVWGRVKEQMETAAAPVQNEKRE